MNTRRIREVTLSINQLRIEADRERDLRAEQDRIRSEQEKVFLQELIALTTESGE